MLALPGNLATTRYCKDTHKRGIWYIGRFPGQFDLVAINGPFLHPPAYRHPPDTVYAGYLRGFIDMPKQAQELLYSGQRVTATSPNAGNTALPAGGGPAFSFSANGIPLVPGLRQNRIIPLTARQTHCYDSTMTLHDKERHVAAVGGWWPEMVRTLQQSRDADLASLERKRTRIGEEQYQAETLTCETQYEEALDRVITLAEQ